MYMEKIWKKCFREKNQLFLLLLCINKIIDLLSATFKDRQISK
jgi:hypothetical protein